jgi:hypothetical protein
MRTEGTTIPGKMEQNVNELNSKNQLDCVIIIIL